MDNLMVSFIFNKTQYIHIYLALNVIVKFHRFIVYFNIRRLVWKSKYSKSFQSHSSRGSITQLHHF